MNIKYKLTPFSDYKIYDLEELENIQEELSITYINNPNNRVLTRRNKEIYDFSGTVHTYINDSILFATTTFKNGYLHSYNGNPAETTDSIDRWYKDGIIHREDGPAQIFKQLNNKKMKYGFFLNGVCYKIEEYVTKIDEEIAVMIIMNYY